jgi:hypothetical protein
LKAAGLDASTAIRLLLRNVEPRWRTRRQGSLVPWVDKYAVPSGIVTGKSGIVTTESGSHPRSVSID